MFKKISQIEKEYDEKMLAKKWKPEHEEKFMNLFSALHGLESFNHHEIEKLVKTFIEENALGFGDVLPLLRIAVTGTMQGPPIFEVMALLGKDTVHNRLLKGITLAKQLVA